MFATRVALSAAFPSLDDLPNEVVDTDSLLRIPGSPTSFKQIFDCREKRQGDVFSSRDRLKFGTHERGPSTFRCPQPDLVGLFSVRKEGSLALLTISEVQ